MSEDPHGGHDGSLDYHRRMIGDPHRVDAYERALRALVAPGDVVLDVGAGTGLLSLLAARRGARVHAVESMPIAGVIERLANDNGLAASLAIHRIDVRELVLDGPVDVVVSDFMGRFVADDFMLEAMRAALRWLKPGGHVIPEAIDLRLAPVELHHLPALDVFEAPIAGLDLSALAAVARSSTYPIVLDPAAVLAPDASHAVVRPGDGLAAFAGAHVFTVTRAGRLRGLAGWFEARLAPGVVLATGPGVESHWDQLLFPLPATRVEAGDVVAVRLWIDDADPDAWLWRWEGEIRRAGAEPVPFSLSSLGRLDAGVPRDPPWLDHAALEVLNEEGGAAFARRDYAAAAAAFARAVAGLGPEHDEIAPLLWENLGLAYFLDDRPAHAVGPFLRALDGDLASREQSARLLVDACEGSGRHRDAARFRAAYEANFGDHPSRDD
ncbi:MAG: methyltransferase domain-containing protein [Deltaproteobacteria bacterium]|nr:MAG: methyltransferase domain-containing protein [Deltaproteobacteria bacterium]